MRMRSFLHPSEDDMDGQMILGCTGFLLLSVLGYALAVWPFFAFLAIETRLELARNVALGGIPHLALTAFGARRFGVAGACGAAGGAASVAVFLYLRLSQVGAAALVDQGRAPEYGPAVATLLPCLWLGTILGAAILAVPGEKRAHP